jgi:hypothetical protein
VTPVSFPPLSVTVVQLPEKPPQAPLLSVASSRSRMLVVESTPAPPSVPPFFVTGTERLVKYPAVTPGAVTDGAVVSAAIEYDALPEPVPAPFVALIVRAVLGAVVVPSNV